MNNMLLSPGHRVCEYRLIIPLSEALQKTITQLQRELHDRYRLQVSFGLPASLTVLRCHAYESTEEKLIERLQQVAARTGSFKVELKGFAALPPNSICIDVPTRLPFQELAKELRVVKSLIKIPDYDPQFIHEPQLLMTQGLKPFQFTRMWMDCEHTVFTGGFIASRMLLMKRSIPHSRYEETKGFEFASLHHLIKQGTLFG
jgi:hypothetical protein